jgi:hypothetical protein
VISWLGSRGAVSAQDLELADEHAAHVGGGDKAATGRASISEITVTKPTDPASPKSFNQRGGSMSTEDETRKATEEDSHEASN